MQHAETLKPSFDTAPKSSPDMKAEKGKSWIERMQTSVGDTIRDIDTASQMAKSNFDGDTALMRVARGGMTVAIGLGLEKAIDETWKQAFAGNSRIFFRPEVQIDAKALKKLESIGLKKGKLGPSFYYFVREGTKDLMVGLLYNGLAFFSRPMLPSVEGKHLVGSTLVNIAESVFEYPQNIQSDIYDIKGVRNDATDTTKPPNDLTRIEGWTARNTLLTLLRASNPPTQLGVGMMKDGWDRFRKNLKEVHRVRKERGGLEGKRVYMQGNEESHYNQRNRPWERRTDQRSFSKDNKVYVGQSDQSKKQQQEEEEIAKLI